MCIISHNGGEMGWLPVGTLLLGPMEARKRPDTEHVPGPNGLQDDHVDLLGAVNAYGKVVLNVGAAAGA